MAKVVFPLADKKKLLYVVRYPLDRGFHLKNKFDGQIEAFRQLGYDTYLIGFDRQHFYLVHGSEQRVIGKAYSHFPNYFHTLVYPQLFALARKVIRDEGIGTVYYRSAPAFRGLYSLMRDAKKGGVRFIFEIPTYAPDKPEKDVSFVRRAFRLYTNIWDRKVKGLPDLYVFMGDGHFTTFNGTRAIRIENGLSQSGMPIRHPVNDGETIHILALSSMCEWHGYDRLIRSLAQYKGDKDVLIHMVGSDDGHCLEKWKKLASDLGVGTKVIFHGPLYGEELTRMFDACDIGVNSLGMYRKGMDDTSELKTREYMVRGLPFVSSVYDAGLDGLDDELTCRVSNDDTVPAMEDIVRFALKMKSRPDVPGKLRDFAIRTMTWEAQYKKVFERLEEKI